MTFFVIGAVLLVAIAWAMLSPAGRTHSPGPANGGRTHLGILSEQLDGLDRELASGQLDAEQHRIARAELQRRMLEETASAVPDPVRTTPSSASSPSSGRKTLLLVGLAIPLFAAGLYAAIGNPGALSTPTPALASAANPAGAPVSAEALNTMLATLAQRLDKPSNDPARDLQGWTLLARSYSSLRRFTEADHAYARAIALAPNDAQLLADRADVLAFVQGERMAGEPDRLIAKALELDPKNVKALALAGSAAFERKNIAAARSYWQQARDLAPAAGDLTAWLDRSLVEAGGTAGSGGAPAATGGTSGGSALAAAAQAVSNGPARPRVAAGSVHIGGRVSLSPALAAQVKPGDTVFVFARAAEGPRMPLAILRRTVADLPFDFKLDDSMAMSPQMTLSAFPRVVVGARISRSGTALPQPGDLRGESPPTSTGVDNLNLVINAVQP